MSKEITLKLSEKEYSNLLFYYNLGYLVADHVTEKDQKKMIEEMEFSIKICKQGYDQGSTVVFGAVNEGMYTMNQQMEERMLEVLEEFKDYIESGEDAAFDAAIEKRVEELMKEEKKKKRK